MGSQNYWWCGKKMLVWKKEKKKEPKDPIQFALEWISHLAEQEPPTPEAAPALLLFHLSSPHPQVCDIVDTHGASWQLMVAHGEVGKRLPCMPPTCVCVSPGMWSMGTRWRPHSRTSCSEFISLVGLKQPWFVNPQDMLQSTFVFPNWEKLGELWQEITKNGNFFSSARLWFMLMIGQRKEGDWRAGCL